MRSMTLTLTAFSSALSWAGDSSPSQMTVSAPVAIDHLAQLAGLTRADVGGRIGFVAALDHALEHLRAGGLGQCGQLGQARVGVGGAAVGPNTDQHNTFQAKLAVLDLGDVGEFGGQSGDAPQCGTVFEGEFTGGRVTMVGILGRVSHGRITDGVTPDCDDISEFHACALHQSSASLAVGHEYRRAAQETGGVGDGDRDLAAGDPHRQGAGVGAEMAQRGDGGGHRARAARPGLPHPAFVHPHGDSAVPTGAVSTSTLTPSGNCAASNDTGAATSRAARSAAVSSGSTHARCGLPTSTARPVNRRPPTVASPGAELVGLAHLDGRRRRSAASAECSTTGRGPASEPTTNSSRSLQPGRPQVVGEHPDAVAAHLRDRSVGVAVVHEPVVGRDTLGQPVEHARRRAPRRRWSPAARRRRRVRGADRTAPPPRPGVRSSRAVEVGQQRRSRSAFRALWRTSPDQDTCRHAAGDRGRRCRAPHRRASVMRWSRRNQDRCRRT